MNMVSGSKRIILEVGIYVSWLLAGLYMFISQFTVETTGFGTEPKLRGIH